MKEAQHGFHEDAVEFVHAPASILPKPSRLSKHLFAVLAACVALVVATIGTAIFFDGVSWPLLPHQYPPFIALVALIGVIVFGFFWLRRG